MVVQDRNGGVSPDERPLLAETSLGYLWRGFREYREFFEQITRRALHRFENGDWPSMRADTIERLDLYEKVVLHTQQQLEHCLGRSARHKPLWLALKNAFEQKARNDPEAELACTFYNSVNRRIFQTVGIETQLEFIAPQPALQRLAPADALHHWAGGGEISAELVTRVIAAYGFNKPFAGLTQDSALTALHLARHDPGPGQPWELEMLPTPFFRDTHAYLIGRLKRPDCVTPLVLSLGSGPLGLYVDAVLRTQEQVRVLFSFSRAYFHVETACVGSLVRFLKDLMPRKRTAELYISLGFHKHGKTELYNELLHHRQVCGLDRFEHAQGQPGMVMIAFNMAQDDLIYKLIRDRFAQPKKTTREQIMQRYDYVFKHDRAGRLVDVQTFENLGVETCCFTPELLEEIGSQARKTVTIADSQVTLHHVYVERRVTPLDVYLKDAAFEAACAVVIDYGQAIKDLAQVNVFPGDLLIKNFGVTRLGRVVFYDYDELCPLTQCHFRRIPRARRYEDALEADPWFAVAENDVFPEEFLAFLGLPPRLREVFQAHHGDLLLPDFWIKVQAQIKAGQWMAILPYAQAQRLRTVTGGTWLSGSSMPREGGGSREE